MKVNEMSERSIDLRSDGCMLDKKDAEQVNLLKELGAKDIPVLESGRIKLILKLQ